MRCSLIYTIPAFFFFSFVIAADVAMSATQATSIFSAEVIELEQPVKVEREAVLARDLPSTPRIRVPTYPEEGRWYNRIGDVIVLWDLPDDIVQTSTRLSRTRDSEPGERADELLTGRNFGPLTEDGTWYARVQFRNNIGWGELAYYEIRLDTTPPEGFSIQGDTFASDNPSPTFTFETSDSLSGIHEYVFFIDDVRVGSGTSTSFTLPPQKPGMHTFRVRVLDRAGNSVEDDASFEVIPIPTPRIEFITSSISQGELLFASGSAVPNGFIDFFITNAHGAEVIRSFTASGEGGKWEIAVDEIIPRGVYTLVVTARDERGALSLASEPVSFRIKAPTILTLGFIELGWFEIVLIGVILIFLGGGIVVWWYIEEQKKREAYKIIAIRDVEKLTTLLLNDMASIENWYKEAKISKRTRTESDALFLKIQTNTEKMKKYLRQEMEKIR